MNDLMEHYHPTIRSVPMPARIAALPVTPNGYPTLFFAEYINGLPDLRIMSPLKLIAAIKHKLCWLCGQPLGRHFAFVLGPMCCVTRTTSEPPSHLECAEYAAKACPFLTRPRAQRREVGLPDKPVSAGLMLKRNPGVTAVWVTRSFKPWRPPDGQGVLMTVGDPETVSWWAEGRQATYLEVTESIESGAPALIDASNKDPDPVDSMRDLSDKFAGILPLLQGLPGREQKAMPAGINESVMILVRADEMAWFAEHADEREYVRRVLPGEYPAEMKPTPRYVKVRKIDDVGNQRSREFGDVIHGEFVIGP